MVPCPRCGTNVLGPPGARRVCSSCGHAMILPLEQAPAPVAPRAAQGAGSFTPPVSGPPGAFEAPGASAYAGPKKNSVPAVLALIFGLIPCLLLLPGFLNLGDGSGEDLFSGLALFALPLSIAAIVLGIVGLKQCNREPTRYKGRGMAIAGLTLGIVFTSLIIIAIVIVVIFCLAYISAYGRSTAMMAPCPAVAMMATSGDPRVQRKTRVRLLLAHHPDCGAFSKDVVNLFGVRVCASCFAFVAAATVVGYALFFVPPASALAAPLIGAAAFLILAPQLLSALRWTTTRARKMLIKALMGVGAASLFSALLVAPWPGWARFAVLNGVTLLAILLILPRKQRLYDEMATHQHDAACGAPA